MQNRIARLVAVVGLVPGSLVAAEPLSLREVLETARSQAREVVAASARYEAAEARLAQARGFRLPSLSFQELWVRTDSPAEVFAFKLNQGRFSFADFMVTDPNRPDPLNTAMSRFELQLPVYTGGELSGRIAQAEAAAAAAGANATWAGEQAALVAAEAYVMLDQAREYVALLERSRETVSAHVDLARAYEAQGMLVRSEVLRAEVELARIDDLLAEARGNARVAGANLAFRLAASSDVEWELEPLPSPVALSGELAEWLQRAADRKDLVAARRMLAAGEREDDVRRAAFLPKVAIVGRADWFDDKLFGTHGSSSAVMAVATINLFAGGSDRAARAAAAHEVRAGRADVERFQEGVRLEARQAYEAAQTARTRHATALKSLEAAREGERITGERFRAGVVRTLDVLDAATARREAETRELVARAEAQAASVRLAVTAGVRPEEVLP